MILYLSYCEISYEGSYVMGIYPDLASAQAKCEQALHEDLHQFDSIQSEPEKFSENEYRVSVWDTDTQSCVDWHSYDQVSKNWESKAEVLAKHQLKTK